MELDTNQIVVSRMCAIHEAHESVSEIFGVPTGTLTGKNLIWWYALDSGTRYIWCLGAGPRACLIIDLSGAGSTATDCWTSR